MADLDSAFGVTIETGNKAPPLAKLLLQDAKPEAIAWFQNAEIKNGRMAMLATVGFVIQKLGIHLPLYLGPSAFQDGGDAWYLSTSAGVTFADVAKAAPLDAIQLIPTAGWLQILFAASAFECTAFHRTYNLGGRVPGDYGYDPLGFTKVPGGTESEQQKKLRIQEIKNGRLAMIAIAGWVSDELIPGSFPVFHPW